MKVCSSDTAARRLTGASETGTGGWLQVGLLQKNPARLDAPTPDPVDEMSGFEVESCDLLRGDEKGKVVTWCGGTRSDIMPLGESLLIRVRMSRAKLFALARAAAKRESRFVMHCACTMTEQAIH